MQLLPVEVKIQNAVKNATKEKEALNRYMEICSGIALRVNNVTQRFLYDNSDSRNVSLIKGFFIETNKLPEVVELLTFLGIELSEVLNELEEAPDHYYEERFELLLDQMGI